MLSSCDVEAEDLSVFFLEKTRPEVRGWGISAATCWCGELIGRSILRGRLQWLLWVNAGAAHDVGPESQRMNSSHTPKNCPKEEKSNWMSKEDLLLVNLLGE